MTPDAVFTWFIILCLSVAGFITCCHHILTIQGNDRKVLYMRVIWHDTYLTEATVIRGFINRSVARAEKQAATLAKQRDDRHWVRKPLLPASPVTDVALLLTGRPWV